jgi:CRP-like cAMP-binding protein
VNVIPEPLGRHRTINAITRGVHEHDWPRWQPHAKLVHFAGGEPDTVARDHAGQLIFPTSAIFSLSSESLSGGLAESSLVGNEGVVGVWMLAPRPQASTGFVLQTPGFGIVVGAEFLTREFALSQDFRLAILGHASAMLRYATQTCFCYRYHTIEQQVTKTILLTLRRTGRRELEMTHQMIATILGLRREAVSIAIKRLQELGMIEQQRSRIAVSRPAALETLACECYDLLRSHLGPEASALDTTQERQDDLRDG